MLVPNVLSSKCTFFLFFCPPGGGKDEQSVPNKSRDNMGRRKTNQVGCDVGGYRSARTESAVF